MPRADTWVVVLARDPRGAKSRLGAVLDEGARGRLAVAMLEDVVASGRAAAADRLLVATESPLVRAVAARRGVETIAVTARGTREAAADAIAAVASRGAAGAAIVAADLPALRPDDVAALLAAARSAAVTAAPDRHGTGTNALVLRPPLVLAPLFGDDSFAAHRDAAARAGLRFRRVIRSGLALDVDTPDDLRAALAHGALGPRTAAALAEAGQALIR